MSLNLRDFMVFLSNNLYTLASYSLYMANTGYSEDRRMTTIYDFAAEKEVTDFTTDLGGDQPGCLSADVVEEVGHLTSKPLEDIELLKEGRMASVEITTANESHYLLCCLYRGDVYVVNMYGGVYQSRMTITDRETFLTLFNELRTTRNAEVYEFLFHRLTGFNSYPVAVHGYDYVVDVQVRKYQLFAPDSVLVYIREYLFNVVKGFIDARGVENEEDQFWELVGSVELSLHTM